MSKDKPSNSRNAKSARPRAAETVDAERSKAVKKSWADKKVAAARSTKHKVKVGGEVYNSVGDAFRKLKLPFSQHTKFRAELKATASGRKTYTDEKGNSYAFSLVTAG